MLAEMSVGGYAGWHVEWKHEKGSDEMRAGE